MYSRVYAGQELRFEASGGLMNSSLVMQDKETDSYWAIMKGAAVGGRLAGTRLEELAGSEKVAWSDWRSRHPETLVLSVRGRQWIPDVYEGYWRDEAGFRGQRATDRRLQTKTPIYAFERDGKRYAVPHARIEGGAAFSLLDGTALFLYRPPGAPLLASTAAFVGDGFVHDGERWIHVSGAAFDPAGKRFAEDLDLLGGFDTFWYNWSLNNPDTEILESPPNR